MIVLLKIMNVRHQITVEIICTIMSLQSLHVQITALVLECVRLKWEFAFVILGDMAWIALVCN